MLEMKWCEHGPKFNSSMDIKMGGQSDPFSTIQFKLLLIVTQFKLDDKLSIDINAIPNTPS